LYGVLFPAQDGYRSPTIDYASDISDWETIQLNLGTNITLENIYEFDVPFGDGHIDINKKPL
jgi:hypothetical protein